MDYLEPSQGYNTGSSSTWLGRGHLTNLAPLQIPAKEAHLALLHLGIHGPLRTDVGVRASDLNAMPFGPRLFLIS
jgi:hypothetical protein